jgi:hypothetical protein
MIFTPNTRQVDLEEKTAIFGRQESTQSQMTEISRNMLD